MASRRMIPVFTGDALVLRDGLVGLLAAKMNIGAAAASLTCPSRALTLPIDQGLALMNGIGLRGEAAVLIEDQGGSD